MAVGASRPLADVLLDVAVARDTLAILTLLWAGVAWLTSQVPQLHAVGAAVDGLPRSELLALHALGLDNPLWSLGVWLLGGLTVFAAIARWLRAPVRWRVQPLLVALGLGAILVSAALATSGAPPVLLDVTIGNALTTVPALTADGGGLAPAPGRWKAACQPHAPPDVRWLECAVEGAGLRHQVSLAAGSPAVDKDVQITWLASATAPLSERMTLHWRAKATPDVFAVALQADVPSTAPALSARLQPLLIQETGPLVLVTDSGAKPGMRLLASPDVLPAGRPSAQVIGQPTVRLQVQPAFPVWPLFLGFVLLFVAFVLPARAKRDSLEVG